MNKCIVNETSTNIRFLARQSLKGLWKPAILAVFIYGICTIVPTLGLELVFGDYSAEALENPYTITASSFIASTYSLLVEGAFMFGISVFFIDLVRERKADPGQVFAGFGYYFKTLGLALMTSLLILLWTCLLIVPGIIAAIRYSQAFYILADDPDKSIMQCIRESKELMAGNKAKYVWLQLSFIGWYALAFVIIEGILIVALMICIFFPYMATGTLVIISISLAVVLGMLVLVFLLPYVQTATIIFYEMANGNLRRAEEEIPPLVQDTNEQVVNAEVPTLAEPVNDPDVNEKPPQIVINTTEKDK